MPTAFINQEYCQIRLTSERLEVSGRNSQTGREEVVRQIPIRDLDRLNMVETVQITSQALSALLKAGIPINIIGWSGQFLGGFLPAMNSHGQARLRQYQRTMDPAFTMQMAGRIITAKIYNQRRVLQRLSSFRKTGRSTPELASDLSSEDIARESTRPAESENRNPVPMLDETVKWLDALFCSLKTAGSLDELRGFEGISTARYFAAWAGCLPSQFPFERRSTRPPHNPVNACISFGSTLLYSEAAAFVHAHGLDPALGMLHATEDGRWSLPLDLMEPFRPALVEALALDLFSHQILNEKHFEPSHGGIYLNEEGRKKFILQYERRMERQFLSESIGHRTTLRQALEQQAIDFKSALENSDVFEPFLIN